MKIYTGSGDKGKTSLFSGERVSKNDRRVEAFGDVDELNSLLGLLAATLPRKQEDRIREIDEIQSILFQIGAWLATTRESPAIEFIEKITEERIRFLEEAIDSMSEKMPALKAFIVPGGHLSAGMAHMARTVCRRAERHVVPLSEAVKVGKAPIVLKGTLIFLNRLSDYLFTLARYCNWSKGLPDKVWGK
jgi:cob(I)alamin adenosyltransferase